MTKNDQPIVLASDVFLALALLTRLPVSADHSSSRSNVAVWAYPLAGLVPGILAVLAGLLSQTLGLTDSLSALLALTTLIVTTGAMHEDGLADTADGFWGGWNKERRLEIMKDSKIGTYGVLSLLVSFGLRWSALTWLFEAEMAASSILAAAVLSRACMPVVMSALSHARDSGLSHSVGRVERTSAAIAIGIAFVLGLILLGNSVWVALFWAAVATSCMAMLAKRKIDGQTGDVLGATQQIVEIIILLTLVA